MAADKVGIEERLDERVRREAEVIRRGMRALLLTGVVLVALYGLAALLIFL